MNEPLRQLRIKDEHTSKHIASDKDSDSCTVPLSTAAAISSASSHDPCQTTAIEALIMALESDRELAFAFEDAMLVTSRRKFLQQHVLLLHEFLVNVQLKKSEWREAIEFFSRKRIIRKIAEEICDRSAANSTLLCNEEKTSESPSEPDRLQPPVNLGTMSLPAGLEGEHLADQHESSDESENNDPGYGTKLHEITTSQADNLVQSLIEDVCFSQYKSSLEIFVHRSCSPNTLRSAIRLGNVDGVRGIIHRHFDAVAADEFEWLQELESLGYSNHDIAELLLDDMNKSPWIYFSQPTPQETAILPGFHIPNCVHTGGRKANLGPNVIVELI